MSGRSLLPDSPWMWRGLWFLKALLGVAGAILIAIGEWYLALATCALLVLLAVVVLLGERIRLLPDSSEVRRTYRQNRQRRNGETRAQHFWRLFRQDIWDQL